MASAVPTFVVRFDVTPRFDVFYALRALQQPGDFAHAWKEETSAAIPRGFDSAVRRVAPKAMMWPLLADSLRDAKPNPTFDEIVDIIRSLGDEAFQRAVLGGVFRGEGVVDDLIAGRQTLHAAVDTERKRNNALVSLIGLSPFQRSGAVVGVFNRIVSSPSQFRGDMSRALEMFWESAFSYTWKALETRMKRRAAAMRDAEASDSLAAFALRERLPVVFDDRSRMVNTPRGAMMFQYGSLRAVHFIPSAFNDARFWGAYTDKDGSTKLYFPVFDPLLLQAATLDSKGVTVEDSPPPSDPALGFRALGDTTRYAMACVIARSPRTSVELAKDFDVSKATISHHVQMLRNAGLLIEKQTDRGVALTLDRNALESLSRSAARQMFTGEGTPVIRRSRHEGSARESERKKKGRSEPSTESAE